MSKPCIICYRLSNAELRWDWDARETLKGFFPLLGRLVELDKSSGGEADVSASANTLVPLENLINAGIISCEDCSKVVNSFCELYGRMESIQLELNSKLRALKGIMSGAEKAPARKRAFKNGAKKLTTGDDASIEESIDWVFNFKQDLVEKCTWKLGTSNIIKHPDQEVEIVESYSIPVADFDAGVQSSTVEPTPPTIIKCEPMELVPMEEWDHFDADADQLQNMYLSDAGNSESMDMEKPDSDSDSDVPSFAENDSDSEEEVDEDISFDTPAPIIMTCGSTIEDVENPQSTLDPETGKYNCGVCSKGFKHNKHFKRHYRNVHRSLRYVCPTCDKEYTRQDDYYRHHQSAHTGKFKCSECNETFANNLELTKHQRLPCGSSAINPETGKHKCRLCPNEFEDAEASLNHYQKVHQKSRLPCPVCEKTFSSKKDLQRHHESIHMGVKFQCPRCSKYFSRKDKLIRHQKDKCGMPEMEEPKPKRKLKTKPISRRPVCDQCGQTFTCAGDLKRHINAVHLKIRDHVCDTCGKGFAMPRDLKRHVNSIHLQLREFTCDTCGKGFCRNCELQLHIRAVHLKTNSGTVDPPARDHVCDTCGKGFSMPRDLRRHIDSVHLQLREFTCDKCGKAFNRSTHLKLHVKAIHLKLREHICVQCGKGFMEPRELERHINGVHLQIREHSCELCEKSFSLAKGLRRHMNTVHLQLRKHECKLCGIKFNLKCQLNEHQRKFHPDRRDQVPENNESETSALPRFEEAESEKESYNNDL